MCNFKSLFGPSKGEKAAQAQALQAQLDAAKAAQAAMVPTQDSEVAREAGDARMRRALSMRGVAAAMTGGAMPANAYGAKALMGA